MKAAQQELENQDIRLLSQITHPNGREVGDWGLMTNQEWWRTLRDCMRAAGLLQPDSLELTPKYAMGGWWNEDSPLAAENRLGKALVVEQQCWGSGITVGSFVHGSRGGRFSLGLVHQLAATDGAGDVSTPRMRVEWLPSNRERIADLGIDVWVEEQPRRWCSSTETEKQANRWEWITPNSVTRAWGVETEERDGVRTVKTWAEWLVDRPNPNQESRRGAAEGRIDWKKPWEEQEEPARNIRWEQGEDGVMQPQNTKDAIRMFAEGWLAGRNLIVVTDGGMN